MIGHPWSCRLSEKRSPCSTARIEKYVITRAIEPELTVSMPAEFVKKTAIWAWIFHDFIPHYLHTPIAEKSKIRHNLSLNNDLKSSCYFFPLPLFMWLGRKEGNTQSTKNWYSRKIFSLKVLFTSNHLLFSCRNRLKCDARKTFSILLIKLGITNAARGRWNKSCLLKPVLKFLQNTKMYYLC